MIRKILLSAAIMSAGMCLAAPLSPEEALSRLDGGVAPGTRSALTAVPVYTVTTRVGEPALYVFENTGSNGFKVVSADDATMALLGYSDRDNFDPNNIPPAMQYWLNEYQRQIQYLRSAGVGTRATGDPVIQLPSWSAIEPLLKTTWDQDTPFNNFCPLDGKSLSYTGCVATSMAQALKYFEYPEKPRGNISYQCTTLGKQLEMKMDTVTFDWKYMLNNYRGEYNSTEAAAVALLMKACGYSVSMNYTAQESGAVSGNIAPAMVKYFNYDESIRYYTREFYTYTDWCKMLYDNIKTIGPVIYDGTGAMGGHSFIFDGYDGNGFFHINWGWGGLSNGYFIVDALEPAGIGIGGGSGAFNYGQGAIFNLQPAKAGSTATPQNDVVLFGSLMGIVSGSTLSLNTQGSTYPGWGYQGSSTMQIQIGIGYLPASTPNATPLYLAEQTNSYKTLSPAIYIPTDNGNVKINLANMSLEDGVKYKVFSAYREKDQAWKAVKHSVGFYDYFYLTKTGGTYKVENLTPMELSASDMSLETPLYSGSAVMVKAKITNQNDIDLTKSICLALVNVNTKKIGFLGSDHIMSVGPNQTVEVSWPTTLDRVTGQSAVTKPTDFYLALYDGATSTLFYTSDVVVTMDRSVGTTTTTCEIVVDNAEMEGRYYVVTNPNSFDVTAKVGVTKGYLTDQIYLGVFQFNEQGNAVQSIPFSAPLDDFLFMEEGETLEKTITVELPGADIGDVYWLGVYNSKQQFLGPNANTVTVAFIIKDNSGVESISGSAEDIYFLNNRLDSSLTVLGGKDGISSVEVYYLNGMKAPVSVDYINGMATVDLSEAGKAIVVVTATDRQGNRKSTKLAL